MRIVFIRSNPVAPDPRIEKTVNSLKNHGYEGQVLAWDRSEKYRSKNSILHLTDCDVNIIKFGIPGKFGGGIKENLSSMIKFQMKIILWLFVNRKSYDAIHAYDFDTGYIALKCAKLLKKKMIYDIADYYIDSHGLAGTKIGQYVKKAEDNIINRANAVVICTEKRKQQIYGTKPHNLTVIHNSPASIATPASVATPASIATPASVATSESIATPVSAVPEDKMKADRGSADKLKIVYVGVFEHGRFIKEIAEIVAKRKDCEFHVGGFGEDENYFKKLFDMHKNVYYYGRIPYNRTLELEQCCDVITAMYDPIVPNHFYAAPNKFYEALMLGKPIIMAKNTGMDDVVETNRIGEVIDFDTNSFEMAIDRLIKRKAEWKTISERAKRIYNEQYSWGIMERRLVELYRAL